MMTKKRKKRLKIIGYTLFIVFSLVIIAGFIGIRMFNNSLFKERPNELVYTSEIKPIHFDWGSDSIGGHFEAQAAMLIPIKMKGLTQRLFMQFDTGSPYSFIYENDLNSLRAIGLDIKEVVKDETRYVEDLDFLLGGNQMKASMIKILVNYGNTFDKNDTISKFSIGTIGSDFIDNRIIEMDFKNQELRLYNERPQWMQNSPKFTSFDFTGRRVMLPVTLAGKAYEFLYDSGASAFGLITTKNRFDNYTKESTKEVNYDANGWGNSIPMRSKMSDLPFAIGNTKLNLKRVTYVDMYTGVQRLITPFTRIGGWLGNLPLNQSRLILDTKTEEFAVIND